jgi:GntR family transcriptional regulator
MIKQAQIKEFTNHKYRRLQTELELIISKTKEGGRLLAEPVLAQQLGVSRSTLREAMRTFEAQGYIQRRQGLGTFVVKKSQIIDAGLEKLESIESLAQRINLPVSMGHLDVQGIQANVFLAHKMGISIGESLLRVSRVILAEKRPVAYLIDNLRDGVISADTLQKGFTGSVLDLLLKNDHTQLEKSFAEIQAVSAPADIAHALQIQRFDVLLHFTAELFSKAGQVVDYSESYFLPGFFRFHVVRTVGG